VPSIESVSFDTTGWKLEHISEEMKRWTNDKNEVLSFHFFQMPPDVPCTLTDLVGLRASYRTGLAEVGAALISADVFPIARMDCIKLVFKSPSQQGMVYVGSLTFPFEDFSFVIKIQSAETGARGVRDAVVLDALMQQGLVVFDEESATIKGWASDPYSPEFEAPLLSNKSDDEMYDATFPDHPLTDVRACISRMLRTLRVDEEVLQAPRFVAPQSGPAAHRSDRAQLTGKPWWRFWE
jgi:hypothetical protein